MIPGVYDISAANYHADRLTPRPALSNTIGKLLVNRSPLHAWTASPRLNPAWEPTVRKTFDIGKAAHRRILGKGEEIAEIPEAMLAANGAVSTKEAKAFVAEARAAGIVPLLGEDIEQLTAMEAVLRRALGEMRPKIAIDPAHSERAAYAEIDGVWCRCMVDQALPYVNAESTIDDYKTCEDASLDACIRAISGYDYAFQAAHYRTTWQAATGEPTPRRVRFIFQEKSPPFEVGIVSLTAQGDGDWWETAEDKVRDARYLWRRCLETGVWPGYPRQEAEVGAPAWYVQKWEQRAKPSAEALSRAAAWQKPERIAG